MPWNPAGSLRGPAGPAGPPSWAGGVFAAGNVSGTWAPNPANGPEQEATLAGAVTLAAPSTAGVVAGQRVLVAFGATGASRVLTLAAALPSIAGMPRARQVPVGGQVWALLRYSGALARWSVVAFPQEA